MTVETVSPPPSVQTETTAAPPEPTISYEYVTERGYQYQIDITINKPTLGERLSDPGKIRITYDRSFVDVTVSNATDSREAPLSVETAVSNYPDLWVSTFIQVPAAFSRDVSVYDCVPSDETCYVRMDVAFELPVLLGIGESVTLTRADDPSLDTADEGSIGPIPEDRQTEWRELLERSVDYIVVSGDSVSDAFGGDDGPCGNGVIAVLDRAGAPLHAKGGCGMELKRVQFP